MHPINAVPLRSNISEKVIRDGDVDLEKEKSQAQKFTN